MFRLRLLAALVLAPFSSASADPAAMPVPGVKHVVLIGFDGFGAYAYPKAEMPRLKALVASGSSTFVNRTVLGSSSAQNWASHLMGAGPELHGYTDWNTVKPNPPSRVLNKYGMFPGIFGEMRQQRPDAKLGVVYNWGGIKALYENKAVDFQQNTQTMEQTSVVFANYLLKEKPTLAFVHFNEPDTTGHGPGHDTPEYYEALKGCDKQLGRILDAIKEAGMNDDTIVMVVADHGGIGKGHGGKTLQEMQTPWVIAGPGVKAGYTIQATTMNYDTAPTIAYIFGLTPPEVWRGRPVKEVFGK